jgi:hypothetical protein
LFVALECFAGVRTDGLGSIDIQDSQAALKPRYLDAMDASLRLFLLPDAVEIRRSIARF